jgi:hypothetical protein
MSDHIWPDHVRVEGLVTLNSHAPKGSDAGHLPASNGAAFLRQVKP